MSFIERFLQKRGGANASMSMIEHVEALRWHIVRSFVVILIGAIVAFINIDFVFDKIIIGPARSDFIAYEWFCKLGNIFKIEELCMEGVDLQFQNTQLAGQFLLSLSVSLFVGFIIAFPYVFWEFWRFLRPALKESEAKMASGIVFWSSLLFLLGVLFSYFIVTPFTIGFFSTYELSPQFKNIITIKNYYDTLFDLILGIGLVFQLPIVVYFLTKVGIITPQLMRSKRKYAFVIIMFVAAVITPPDVFSMVMVWLPMLLLYEVSILLSVRVYKARQKRLGLDLTTSDKSKPLDW